MEVGEAAGPEERLSREILRKFKLVRAAGVPAGPLPEPGLARGGG